MVMEPLKDNQIQCTEESKEIKAINKETVHQICAGQVVLSLAIAMKELVENSVDAKATIINIHLKEFGSELLEVSDNGCGVNKDNFQALTLKHYTSKLREFNDLEELGTLGFRGEALSSLCALAEVDITTKHQFSDVATKLKYDSGGKIISEEITARQQGTTVSLRNLFSSLPVRRKEFEKNLKKEFVKLCNLLYAYCLLPSGIKYKCTNITNKGSQSTVVATEGHLTVRENIISVFGVKQVASLIDVKMINPDENTLEDYGLTFVPGEEIPFDLEFLVSSAVHGCGRSSTDRQFYYINNRPCELSKLIKLVNEVYRQFNSKQYPFVYLNITTKSSLVDVNITPDKRQVFLEQEKLLLATVKASLLEAFKDTPSTFKMQNLEVSQCLSKFATEKSRGIKRSLTEGSSRKSASNLLESFKKKSKSEEISQNGANCLRQISITEFADTQEEVENKLQSLVKIACRLAKDDDDEEVVTSEVQDNSDIVDDSCLDITVDSPIHSDRKVVKLKSSLSFIKEKLSGTNSRVNCEDTSKQKVRFRSDIAPETNNAAEDELNKYISKTDFGRMTVLGQFNKGFIITKLDDDLFIVDQHATDEKYNFEQLQKHTVMENQRLVTPKLLELTTAAKSTLLENIEVFKKNGFNLKIDEAGGEEKIYLTSIPMSDKTVFGKSDIDEMIFMLQEDSSQFSCCRPSRIRSMFASRACRQSVMIGKSLSLSDMKRLVSHMGEIEQPWNCPHGRPTMRHLVNLNLLLENID